MRPDHFPSRAERLQCVQIRSLRASQRSPPVFVQKVVLLLYCVIISSIDRNTDVNQYCSLLQGKRERRPIDKSRKGEVSIETGADCQNQGGHIKIVVILSSLTYNYYICFII